MATDEFVGQQGSDDLSVLVDTGGGKHQKVVLLTTDASGEPVTVGPSVPVPVQEKSSTKALLYRYLDTNGDGTGTNDGVGDYSAGATQFYIAPGAGEVFKIARMIVCVNDTNGMSAGEYGNLGSALTNGIRIEKQDNAGTTLIELDAGLNVKTNAGWGGLCYDVDLKTWGAGDELLLVRWTFDKAGGPLVLDGDSNERLTVILNDDLTGLLMHLFHVQGYSE